ncbi:MAG: extracellular solute-binding protein [Lachnospiraceae bacterium]|nr:extracellular solute-binding protein [Lachnospiraceae bacterium]
MKKELISLFLLILVTLSGCGSRETGGEPLPAIQSQQSLYVPEFLSLEGENIDYDGMRITTDTLCYLSYAWSEEIQYYELLINTFSLQDRTTGSFPLVWPEGPRNQAMTEYTFGEDGSLYAIAQTFPTEEVEPGFLLCKFHPDGELIFSQDVTEQLLANPETGVRINAMETDSRGRIYIAGDSVVWLYDEQGEYKGILSPGEMASGTSASEQDSSAGLLISGLYRDGKDKMYLSYGEAGYGGQGDTLAEIDFDGKGLTEVCGDFPTVNTFSPHPDQSFLMQDRTSVYAYDPAAPEQAEALFSWMDCDISGQSVLGFGQTTEGRIAAVLKTQDRSGELALLTKVSPEEAVQKETLVLGVLTGAYNYEPAVVRFNRINEKYRIVLKEYYNYENHENFTLEDALARLYADLVSDHCPDLLEVTGLNLTQLAAQDVFQDLSPYLEQSSVFGPEDFVSEILDTYTFDGTLVTIPYAVFLETVMGNAGQIDPEAAWTPENVIALADANPDAELFDGADRNDIMNFLMEYGENAFVNWNTGECSFDSEQFKSLLEFVKRFPETVEYDPDRPSTPSRIQSGKVLLKTVELYNFDTIQIDLETFGSDAVCIGYPTAEGGRHAMTAIFSYAITSGSKNKDGAWTFIESMLSEEGGSNGMGFPSVKQRLENCLEDAVAVKYMLDEKGEIYLDENGEPVVIGNTSSVQYGDGWSYTYHTATREEAELILSLLSNACPSFTFIDSGNEIRSIISEEAAAFYAGQKTVEETAKVIQSRAQLYVDENR